MPALAEPYPSIPTDPVPLEAPGPSPRLRLMAVEPVRAGARLDLASRGEIGWTRVRLAWNGPLIRPLRLLHVTDLHLRRRVPQVFDRLADQVAASCPDAVLVTGDYVDDKFDHAAEVPLAEQLIPRLRSRLGTFGILGNHDGDLLAGHLSRWNLTDVTDRAVEIVEAGRPILRIAGLPGVDRDDPTDLLECCDLSGEAPLVVLSHFPDVINRLGRVRPDLVLAGHTHGGQICLPGGWAPMTHDSLPRRMCAGVHPTASGVLIVGRGVGTTKLPIRFFSPAEVVEVVIESGS